MPGRGTPMHAFRVPDAVWDRLQEVAKAAGTDRSTVLRVLIAWYLREPGAKLPKRPNPRALDR